MAAHPVRMCLPCVPFQLELQTNAFDEFKLPIVITQGKVEGVTLFVPPFLTLLGSTRATLKQGFDMNVKDRSKHFRLSIDRIVGVCQPLRTLESDWDEEAERRSVKEKLLSR